MAETTTEKLARLNAEAKRLHGTVYYDGKHADINLALDEWMAEDELVH